MFNALQESVNSFVSCMETASFVHDLIPKRWSSQPIESITVLNEQHKNIHHSLERPSGLYWLAMGHTCYGPQHMLCTSLIVNNSLWTLTISKSMLHIKKGTKISLEKLILYIVSRISMYVNGCQSSRED